MTQPRAGSKRVVLLEPGDVLIIKNLSHFSPRDMDELSKHLVKMDIVALLFASDLDLDSLTQDELLTLRAAIDAKRNQS